MKIFDLGTSPIHTCLFLQREIINILDVVFTGYKTGEHRFLQPDSGLFAPSYEILILRYGKLRFDHEVEEYIDQKHITITNLTMYSSLTDNFDFHIEAWNREREQLLKERAHLMTIAPSDSYIERDIKLTVYELQKLLPEHKKQKEAYLQTLLVPEDERVEKKKDNIVSIDPAKAKLHIYGQNYNIQIKSQEFIFFQALLDHPDETIPWKIHAEQIGLGVVNHSDADIARLIQDMKTKLRVKLRKLGVNKRTIVNVCNQIRAVRKAGYIFRPLR